MMAFLQMDKNFKRTLTTSQDYKNASKLTFEHANDFFTLCANAMYTLFPQAIPAITANIAFSCELYLKCILLYEQQEIKGHYLDDLFSQIKSVEVKQQIKDFVADKDFDISLKEVRKAFEICRYENEYPVMACNMRFLGVLMASLKRECEILMEVAKDA